MSVTIIPNGGFFASLGQSNKKKLDHKWQCTLLHCPVLIGLDLKLQPPGIFALSLVFRFEMREFKLPKEEYIKRCLPTKFQL